MGSVTRQREIMTVGIREFHPNVRKTSNTVATQKPGTILYVHGYSELKNSWKLPLPRRIKITNKTGINTTRYIPTQIAAISHRSNHASNPLPLHEFLKRGAAYEDRSSEDRVELMMMLLCMLNWGLWVLISETLDRICDIWSYYSNESHVA